MNLVAESSSDTGYSRPRDPAELWLARRWQDVLGFGVGIRENFFGIGGNSVDAARIINYVLEEFDVELPLNAVAENPTVERLAAVLRGHTGQALSAPLVEIQGGDDTHPPLFLVHPASGQVGPYCHLARALGEEFTLFGLQPTGLHADTEPITTIAGMASAYLEAIRTVEPTGPYLLGGCSTGAAIAFEMACRLTGAGAEVRLLAAIEPDLVEPTESRFGQLTGDRELTGVLDDWKQHDLVPPQETVDFVARSRRVWRANHDAIRDWLPTPYPGPLDLFGDPAGARPSAIDWPATTRIHECFADPDRTHVRELARALRPLIG